MSLAFYSLSGSPFAWKVWLALEHKRIPYDHRLLSADAGDLKSPGFLALNPHGKVPVIVDGDFVLRESSAIIDYLDHQYRDQGASLWPSDAWARARARRIAIEGDSHIYPHVRRLVVELVLRKDGAPDQTAVEEAKAALSRELLRLEREIHGPFIAGAEPSAADFANYPFLAILDRIATRHPELEIAAIIPDGLRPWMQSVEALACFPATIPPHWRRP